MAPWRWVPRGAWGSAAGQPDDLPFNVAFDELRQVLVEPFLEHWPERLLDQLLDRLAASADHRAGIGGGRLRHAVMDGLVEAGKGRCRGGRGPAADQRGISGPRRLNRWLR